MNRLYILLGIVALVAFLAWQFPYAVSSGQDKMHLMYMLTIAMLVSGGAVATRGQQMGHTVKMALIWLAIILGGVLAYSYKDVFLSTRLAAELMPNRPRMGEGGTLLLRASEGGHFYVEAHVNGVPVNFMIDTGASDVMLSKDDAERVGLNPETLNYTRTYSTANGISKGAPIRLKHLSLGRFDLYDFPASVNGGQMSGSLLGMSALNRLGGLKVEGDEMIIGK